MPAIPPPISGLPPGVNAPFPRSPAAPNQRPSSPSVVGPALPGQRINGTDYVDAAAFFARLGLSTTTTPARGSRTTFQGGGNRLDLTADERDATLNGLHLVLGQPPVVRARSLLVSRTDAEHLLGPVLAPAGIAVPPPALRVIALDPGHGGQDAGAVNAALGIFEKTFALEVAQRLKPLLEAKGYQVVMTRNDDRFIPLPERPAFAKARHTDLFISIHFNSVSNDTRTNGTEIYTFAPQGQRSVDSWSAGARDDAELKADASNRFDAWNAVAAHAIHGALLAQVGTADRGQKIRHLAVLRGLDCPGVLVECAFLSNDAEARKAATTAFRQKIAEGLAAGVAAYAAQLPAAKQP